MRVMSIRWRVVFDGLGQEWGFLSGLKIDIVCEINEEFVYEE